MICTNCKKDRAHRSHRKGIREQLASLLGCYPYRCRECQHRFLRSRYRRIETPPSGEHRATEREIRSTQKAKNWRRKKRLLTIYSIALLIFVMFLYVVTEMGMGATGAAGG